MRTLQAWSMLGGMIASAAVIAAPAMKPQSMAPASKGCLASGCHGELYQDKTLVHGPLRAGECSVCHFENSAQHPKNPSSRESAHRHLVQFNPQQVNSTCLTCHDEIQKTLNTPKAPHTRAVQKGCTFCHEAHAGNQAKLLKDDVLTSRCFGCHQDLKQELSSFSVPHAPMSSRESCNNCHVFHEPRHPKLLKSDPGRVCLDCHSKEIQARGGRKVIGLTEILRDSASVHAPVKEGKCSSCHGPHGASETRLLKADYSPRFYGQFSADRFQLCFRCHDTSLATAATAGHDGVTQFRNGTKNLHFFHLNRGKKGYSCAVCHDEHASRQDSLIRSTFLFQGMQARMKFVRTQSGGNCTTSCHKQKDYDRRKEWINEPGR